MKTAGESRSEASDEYVLVAEGRTVIKGPSVGKVKVKLRKKLRPKSNAESIRLDETLFVENEITIGGSQVVEGFLDDILTLDPEGQLTGELLVAVPPMEVLEILPGEEPWRLRGGTNEDRETVTLGREEQCRLARSEVMTSAKPGGTFTDENNERVLVVRLHDKCGCAEEAWEKRDCGHPYCTICAGHVHPVTRVTLKGAEPTVSCNRVRQSEYEFVFREAFAGSEHLTKAMKTKFGRRVEEATDIIKGPQHDMREKWVYEREKKRVKSRCTMIDHWSPNCRTASRANRQPLRWKDEPYGHTQEDKLLEDSVIMVRTARLAAMKHMVGYFFGIEHIWPTPMIEMDCYKELLAMPGVFVLTWDNCMYGKNYVHRQCYITNMWWLAGLSRDCDKSHEHVLIAPQQGSGIAAKTVAPFAEKWCARYAELTHQFVHAAKANSCLVCASIGGEKKKKERVAVSNDRLNARVQTVLPDRITPFVGSADWQEGRWEYDDSGAVLHCQITHPKILARIDRDSKSYKMMPKGGTPWNKVIRRVTIDQDTKEVLGDELSEEIESTCRLLDRSRNVVTVFHYLGEAVDTEVICKAKSKSVTASKIWRDCSETESLGLEGLFKALMSSRPRNGEFLGQHGEIIRTSLKTKYTFGMSKESRDITDIWSRSLYARSDGKWECLEQDVMCTVEMITKVSLGKEVPLLLEIYEPKGPDAVMSLERSAESAPILVMSKPERVGLDDVSEEVVGVATGATRVGKSGGFGKQRSSVVDWDEFEDYEKWFIPAALVKLTKTLGTRTVNELRDDDGGVLIYSGSVVTVAEAVFTTPKPIEVQGQEEAWTQTIYLKSPEGYWYCWKHREASAWGALPYEFSELVLQILEPKKTVSKEMIAKAGHYSYKQEGKKDTQAKMFPGC